MNQRSTVEEMLETVFPTRLYNKDTSQSRVEAGSNTCSVSLRDVGVEEKGSLESETAKYGH
jgi:hypothetical protein